MPKKQLSRQVFAQLKRDTEASGVPLKIKSRQALRQIASMFK